MMKGHTFSILDQSFSTLIGRLHSHAVFTVSRLIYLIGHVLVKYNVIETRELHCIWDFHAWLEPHVNQFGGFATGQFGDGMHEFLVRKDRDGVARILFRKSSQSSSWLPEGEGYPVFKSFPTGTPPLAKLKPDSAWERHQVMATVRRWLPHFTIARAVDVAAAHNEWEQRLWQLPVDLDVANLPDEQKL
eukprot:3743900-Pleurochrysis_carterae.AAC.1